ncbi:hypothetical protein [Planctopirus hydrillae]|uniref:Uncharacterized protein n=1 Tax=Planctopirus hydrillae TaxID=1841610 RepID=A0A1C3E5R0_9PLAN|nr:hypothetical protein [Planctopirus hydrillae]ODA28591.1 hypothetical protein A6X21_12950 [Planctopirus hydrillae]
MTTPVSADLAISADVSARSDDRAEMLVISGKQPSSRQRSGWRFLLMSVIWLGIFLAGGVTGAVIHAYWLRATLLEMKQKPDDMPRRIAEMIAYDYGLSPAQEATVLEIISEHHARVQKLRGEHAPIMESWNAELELKMSKILKPSDFVQFQKKFREVNLIWGGL